MTRTLLVAVCIALLLLVLFGMRVGWRNRGRRQAFLPPVPEPPPDLGTPSLLSTGLYVGTSFSSSWQDRVVHGGLGERADAEAQLHPSGLLIDRIGARPVFLPRQSWVGARLAPGLVGKVTGAGGLLVVRWQLGDSELDTAFRADDKTTYPQWVTEINERVQA